MSRFGHHLYRRVVLWDVNGLVFRTESVAATPRYSQPEEVLERLDGTEVAFPLGHVLELDTDDGEMVAWVQARQRQGIPVSAILEGEDRHLLWLTPVVPRVVTRENEVLMAHWKRVRLYLGETGGRVYDGLANVLARHGWEGLSALPLAYPPNWNGVPDGYQFTASPPGYADVVVAPEDEETVCYLNVEPGATGMITASTPLPLVGRGVAAVVDVASTNIEPGDTLRLHIDALGRDGSMLDTDFVNIDTAGEHSVIMPALPIGTHVVRWQIALSPDQSDKFVAFRSPTLRLSWGSHVSAIEY